MAEAKAPAPVKAEKSAADLLIELQLEEKRIKSINPLVVTEESVVEGKTNIDGTGIATRKVFADGAVLESYA